MKKISDEQLVARFLKGDDKSFERLLNRHLKPVYNFLFRLTGDIPTANDLAQDVFIKAWKKISRFDRTKNFKTWIFTVAKNTAYDFFKKKKTIPFSYFSDREGNNPFDNIPDENLSPDKIFENSELPKDLGKKLKKIPPNYRLILLLRYKDDFSLAEIAEILGKPYNTVKSQHTRVLQQLKKLF